MNAFVTEKANTIWEASVEIHKAFGAPGDYGYGTAKGNALFALYKAANELKNCLNKPVDAPAAEAAQ